jgi:salicylate hydroxylase
LHRTTTRFMYNGPGAHIITYPIAKGTLINALAVVEDDNPWPFENSTAPGRKEEAAAAFRGWRPTARAIIDLFPEEMNRWAIFDMDDHPAPTYVRGAIAMAGDAAHATGPHLGAGAAMGIEDALALSAALETAQASLQTPGADKGRAVRAALRVFDESRRERSQWLVHHTRDSVDLFQWRDPEVSRDPERFGHEITWRFHRIWNYDLDAMVAQVRSDVATQLAGDGKGPMSSANGVSDQPLHV